MNKILIALVLTVVMSGNVYSDITLPNSNGEGDWVHFYCDSEWNESYSFDRKLLYNPRALKYYELLERIIIRDDVINAFQWLPSYLQWSHPERGNFRINRKTLKLEYKSSGNSYYKINSQCYLIDNFQDLKKLVKENYFKKIKGNKF